MGSRLRRYMALLAMLVLMAAGAAPAGADPEPGGITVILLLDRSGSMSRSDPQGLAAAGARALVGLLDPQDRVAVVAFDTTARTVLAPAPVGTGAGARGAIAALEPPTGEWTDMNAALQEALRLLAGEPDRPAAVILFTDGKPETSPTGVPSGYREEMAALTSRLAGQNVPVFGVGLGAADMNVLSQVASATRAEAFAAATPASAVTFFSGVLARLKERDLAFVFTEEAGLTRTFTVQPYTRRLTISAISSGGDVRLRGEAPGGGRLEDAPGLAVATGENWAVYTVPHPAPGLWTVRLEGSGRLQAQGHLESDLRLRLLAPTPYSQVQHGRLQVEAVVEGDPDPGAGLELWAQGEGGAAVRLQMDRLPPAYRGEIDPGNGRLHLWVVRNGAEVLRREFRVYPTLPAPAADPGAAGPPEPAAPPASPPWRSPALAATAAAAFAALLLGLGAWNWRRLRRREEALAGRLGPLSLAGLGPEARLGAGLRPGAQPVIATLQARLEPERWAPLAGLGLGRRILHIYIRPGPGVRLAIGGRPPGDGRLYHGDTVTLGSETYSFTHAALGRRPVRLTPRRRTGTHFR